MTTGLQLITRALKAANIIAMNEQVGGSESVATLDILNMMLDQWSLQNLMAYYKVNETFDLVASQGTYDIGPSSHFDFNTTRPVKLDTAFVRDGTTDYPLTIITNYEYQGIVDKSTAGVPSLLCYIPKNEYSYIETPAIRGGEIKLYPVPDSSTYDIGLSQTKQFANITGLTDNYYLPIGYDSAIVYNLAVELCLHYNKNVSEMLWAKAKETKANIKSANIENEVMVNDYPSACSGSYNIETDA